MVSVNLEFVASVKKTGGSVIIFDVPGGAAKVEELREFLGAQFLVRGEKCFMAHVTGGCRASKFSCEDVPAYRIMAHNTSLCLEANVPLCPEVTAEQQHLGFVYADQDKNFYGNSLACSPDLRNIGQALLASLGFPTLFRVCDVFAEKMFGSNPAFCVVPFHSLDVQFDALCHHTREHLSSDLPLTNPVLAATVFARRSPDKVFVKPIKWIDHNPVIFQHIHDQVLKATMLAQ